MLIHWIWLATRPHLSNREKFALLTRFEDPENCYFAPDAAYSEVEALHPEGLESLKDKDLQEARRILADCRRKQIQILTCTDQCYPKSLENIYDPPLLLYYRGTLPDFAAAPAIGVVGTRKATAYGLDLARQMGKELAACKAVVVSGMAEGIDAMATKGALESGGIPVGVLGCGVDIIYPRCNTDLFRKMERQGCLISEYPPGTRPTKWSFPRRNRIISGLSCGVLVVEAPQKSGALITARQALEQGRDVFVTPGNLGNAACEGSNGLLREGGIAVTCGWDILSEYSARYPNLVRKDILSREPETDKITVDIPLVQPYSDVDKNVAAPDTVEQAVLQAIGNQEQLIDHIIAKTGLPSGEVLAALTLLEVEGLVTTRPGGWVSASKSFV